MNRLALAVLVVLATAGVATSGADFTASSTSPTTITAAADFNTVAASMTAPAATLVASIPLSATASSERGIASVTFQQAPASTSDWVDVCVATTPAYGCSWDTLAVADGAYRLRARALDSAGYTRTTTPTAHTVDNHTLTVTLSDPGAMSGNENLTATAANASGGLAELTIQHRAPGAPSWSNVCTDIVSPKTCSLATTGLPEGPRELRAFARDVEGHQVQSTPITRTIDNTAPTATPSPPSGSSGTISISIEASDSGSGIAYVAIEALYGGSWLEACRDTSAPYTCGANSAQVPDGTYSVRVVTVDNAGVKTTGDPFPVTIDNPPRGTAITTGNVGTLGQLGAGDWVQLTWNEQIAPGSVMTGWTGTSQAVVVRVRDSGVADQMDFYATSGGTRLNLVLGTADLKLNADFVTGGDAEFNATMSQSGPSITITLGTQLSGTVVTAAAGTLTWRPSNGAKDLSNNASSTSTVNESGALDVDF